MTTGPKISSHIMRSPGSAASTRVGSMKYPISLLAPPPDMILLCLRAWSRYPLMLLNEDSEITAPMKFRKSDVSPILISFIIATVRSMTSLASDFGR